MPIIIGGLGTAIFMLVVILTSGDGLSACGGFTLAATLVVAAMLRNEPSPPIKVSWLKQRPAWAVILAAAFAWSVPCVVLLSWLTYEPGVLPEWLAVALRISTGLALACGVVASAVELFRRYAF